MNELQLSKDLKNRTRDTRRQKRKLTEVLGGCEICGYDFTPTLQAHHMVSFSDGGTNDIDNLALLCPNCHSLVHSLINDSSSELMSEEEVDAWLDRNFNKIQKDKILFYALRLLRGER